MKIYHSRASLTQFVLLSLLVGPVLGVRNYIKVGWRRKESGHKIGGRRKESSHKIGRRKELATILVGEEKKGATRLMRAGEERVERKVATR